MKPLILSCNTGAGHNTAAKAVREQFIKAGVDCQMLDALSFASESLSRFVCDFYVGLTARAPGLFGAGYRACEALSSPRIRSASYIANTGYAHTLYRYLIDNKIDTVVMTHIFPAQCLTHIRKRYKMDHLRTYLIATDYNCVPFAEETSTDAFFIPHDSITADYLHRGIGEERVLVSGIPTLEKFSQRMDKKAARAHLGLPAQAPVILVMGGSMGFGNIEDMVRLLRNRMRDQTNIVVLAGNNERLKASLRARFGDDTRIHVVDFTSEADVYMDACDIMLSKPGGLSSTEAAVKNVPLVHMDPIPGCETDNIEFFSHFGMSVSGQTIAETADAAIRLLEKPEMQKAVVDAQRQNTNPDAAADIVRYIMNRAE